MCIRDSVRSVQYLSPCICPFCSISLSLYLSVLFNISLPVSVRSAQYLSPCVCPFCSVACVISFSTLDLSLSKCCLSTIDCLSVLRTDLLDIDLITTLFRCVIG